MGLYEEALSHIIGKNPRNRRMRLVVDGVILFAVVATPITYGHAVWDFAMRKAATYKKWVLDPGLNQLKANIDKQMKAAQLQQQKVQQQKVQSGR